MTKFLMACLLLIASANALAQQQAASPVFIAGSDKTDYQIHCWQGGKLVWGIYDRSGTSSYQVARNITYVPLGGGRYSLDFYRGFTSAVEHAVYFPAADENCEVTTK